MQVGHDSTAEMKAKLMAHGAQPMLLLLPRLLSMFVNRQ